MSLSLAEFPGWRAGFQPPDRRPIYEWAKDHLTLPASYAIQGKFDVSLSRPLIQVFDDIQNPLVNRVRFRKPPRFGGSMIADIAIPWVICNDPGPIMWNWQSDEMAKGHMKEKAWPLWNSSAVFRAMLPTGRHDKTNTEIFFGPFFLVAQGANLNSLQSKGIRWLFNDELWLPVWQELYAHAVRRTMDFERSGSYKIVDVSQAGNEGDVESRNFDEGNRCIWGYPRPGGGDPVQLLMGGKREDGSRWGLVFNEDAKLKSGGYNKTRAMETARYVCKETGKEWADVPETRQEWNRTGLYIPTNPTAPRRFTSYSVNALLTRPMAELVSAKIDALNLASMGDMSGLRDFKQSLESLPWAEQHLSITLNTKSNGYKVADYANGQKLDGESKRTMMMDRQHGIGGDTPHRWVEIRAWRADGSSRLLYFGRFDTKEACREIQQKYGVPDRCVWQDAKYEKHEVFKECAQYGWVGVFGSSQNSWTHYTRLPGNPEALKMTLPYSPVQFTEAPGTGAKAHYLTFCEDYMADILANLASGRGVAWEMPDDVDPRYPEHLKAEHKVEKRPGVFSWEKIHSSKPNHGWDTAKMGVAFAVVMKLLSAEKKAA